MSEHPEQINQLLDYIFAYGSVWVYLAIFTACFVENVFPPFPGDSFIVAAGGLVALGRLDFTLTLLLIITGGMASVMFIYYLGRRFGRSYFIRKDFKYFSASDIEQMEERFRKWGAVVLVASRFIVGMRVVLAVVAGIGRYPAGRMILFSTLSYLLFAGLLFLAAHKLVENLSAVEYYFTAYNHVAWPLLIGLVALLVVHKVRARR
ncbi:MAG: DedA family protein, partial [candidate division Zixibacteria bacterium]|nr:DedA family protein [candidate division Zixibacteria bacterium]